MCIYDRGRILRVSRVFRPCLSRNRFIFENKIKRGFVSVDREKFSFLYRRIGRGGVRWMPPVQRFKERKIFKKLKKKKQYNSIVFER